MKKVGINLEMEVVFGILLATQIIQHWLISRKIASIDERETILDIILKKIGIIKKNELKNIKTA
jgi:hypothetical protein